MDREIALEVTQQAERVSSDLNIAEVLYEAIKTTGSRRPYLQQEPKR